MFNNKKSRKKDQTAVGGTHQLRSGQLQDGKSHRKVSDNSDALRNVKAMQRQPISANDISESYIPLPSEMPRIIKEDPKQMKANKRRLPFLMRKKKSNDGINPFKVNNDNELDNDCEDVVSYEDVSTDKHIHGIDHNSLNPLMLAELKNLKRANEGLKVDESYNGRVDYITNHYRRPPPYPGYPYNQENNNDGNPSMIQQLLHEQRLAVTSKDNASMINYCPVEKSAGLSNEDLTRIMKLFPKDRHDYQTQRDNEQTHDGLVLSTEDRNRKLSNETNSVLMDSDLPSNSSREQLNHSNNDSNDILHVGNLSELYPRDYELANHLPPPDYRDDPDYDIDQRGHRLSKTSISPSLSSRFDSSQVGQQASYVPPSPYLNAEIPDWLQVYSKASQDLDQYLKWDMFRYPELDCWQTMLKRLYKKELEQIVLWFEEYRQALQREIERRSISQRSLGLNPIEPQSRIKKTEV